MGTHLRCRVDKVVDFEVEKEEGSVWWVGVA